MSKPVKYSIAKQRFIDQGRTDIELCEDDFKGWSKKSKFYDLIIKEYYWAVPCEVYKRKAVCMKRAQEKIKQTNLERFGTESFLSTKQFLDKRKETWVKNYGVDNPLKSVEIKEKSKNKLLETFGVDNFSKTEEFSKKYKETCLERYGVDHVSQLADFQEKIKKSCIEKYGEESYSKTKQYKDNVRLARSNRFIEETGEHLIDWLEKQPEPKPAYITVTQHFSNEKLSLTEIKNFIDGFKDKKSELELYCENIFNLKHYNNKPNSFLNYRPDFKLSETIFVNVDGLYWHSEHCKSKKYHFEMRKKFEESGLRLFQFYENELKEKTNIVKSIIANAQNESRNKIYARKCEIRKIEQRIANDFLNENHLMGSINAKHVGLFNNNVLVSLMSYKEVGDVCKIERFCSILNTNVVGGFSKLLKHIENNLLKPSTTEIHNWVDLRYGTGSHLESKVFKLSKETLGWKWTNGRKTFNRLYCRANMDERKLSEEQYAKIMNLHRIYDAGQRLFVKKIN